MVDDVKDSNIYKWLWDLKKLLYVSIFAFCTREKWHNLRFRPLFVYCHEVQRNGLNVSTYHILMFCLYEMFVNVSILATILLKILIFAYIIHISVDKTMKPWLRKLGGIYLEQYDNLFCRVLYCTLLGRSLWFFGINKISLYQIELSRRITLLLRVGWKWHKLLLITWPFVQLVRVIHQVVA